MSYITNLAKSVGYAVPGVIKGNLKNLHDLAKLVVSPKEAAAKLSKDISDVFMSEEDAQTGTQLKTMWRNAERAMRTGNIYDEEKAKEIMPWLDDTASDDAGEFDFGAMDSGMPDMGDALDNLAASVPGGETATAEGATPDGKVSVVMPVDNRKSITVAAGDPVTAKAVVKSSIVTGNMIAGSAQHTVDAIGQMSSVSANGFRGVGELLASIRGQQAAYAAASLGHLAKTAELAGAMLEEMKIIKAASIPRELVANASVGHVARIINPETGSFSLRGYLQYLKEKSKQRSPLGMVGMMLEDWAKAPMESLINMIGGALFSRGVLGDLKKFAKDMAFTGLFALRRAALASDNDKLSSLFRFLNIEADFGGTTEAALQRNTVVEQIPFDSETKRSIVETIPTFLSQILGELQGRTDSGFQVFDSRYGRMRDSREILEEHHQGRAMEMEAALERTPLTDVLSRDPNLAEDQREATKAGVMGILQQMAEFGEHIAANNIDQIAGKYATPENMQFMEKLVSYVKAMDVDEQRDINKALMTAGSRLQEYDNMMMRDDIAGGTSNAAVRQVLQDKDRVRRWREGDTMPLSEQERSDKLMSDLLRRGEGGELPMDERRRLAQKYNFTLGPQDRKKSKSERVKAMIEKHTAMSSAGQMDFSSIGPAELDERMEEIDPRLVPYGNNPLGRLRKRFDTWIFGKGAGAGRRRTSAAGGEGIPPTAAEAPEETEPAKTSAAGSEVPMTYVDAEGKTYAAPAQDSRTSAAEAEAAPAAASGTTRRRDAKGRFISKAQYEKQERERQAESERKTSASPEQDDVGSDAGAGGRRGWRGMVEGFFQKVSGMVDKLTEGLFGEDGILRKGWNLLAGKDGVLQQAGELISEKILNPLREKMKQGKDWLGNKVTAPLKKFVKDRSDKFKRMGKGAGMSGMMGFATGGLMFGPLGALVGGAIGGGLGAAKGWNDEGDGLGWFRSKVKKPVADYVANAKKRIGRAGLRSGGIMGALGAGVGGLMFGPMGFLLGGAMMGTAGMAYGMKKETSAVLKDVRERVSKYIQKKKKELIGTGIGAASGFIGGGVLGQALGHSLGSLIGIGPLGGFIGGTLLGPVFGAIAGGAIGKKITTWLGGDGTKQFVDSAKEKIKGLFATRTREKASGIVGAIAGGIGMTAFGPLGGLTGAALGAGLGGSLAALLGQKADEMGGFKPLYESVKARVMKLFEERPREKAGGAVGAIAGGIGGAMFGPFGGLIGTTLGTTVGASLGATLGAKFGAKADETGGFLPLLNTAKERFMKFVSEQTREDVGATVGGTALGGIGGTLGYMLFGPVGAAAGAAWAGGLGVGLGASAGKYLERLNPLNFFRDLRDEFFGEDESGKSFLGRMTDRILKARDMALESLFGKENEEDGALVRNLKRMNKYLRETFWDPLQETAKTQWQEIKVFFRNDVIDPLQRAFDGFGTVLKNRIFDFLHGTGDLISDLGKSVNNLIGQLIGAEEGEGGFIGWMGRSIHKWVVTPMKKLFDKGREVVWGMFKFMLGKPIEMFSRVSDNMKIAELLKGRGGHLSDEQKERLLGIYNEGSDEPLETWGEQKDTRRAKRAAAARERKGRTKTSASKETGEEKQAEAKTAAAAGDPAAASREAQTKETQKQTAAVEEQTKEVKESKEVQKNILEKVAEGVQVAKEQVAAAMGDIRKSRVKAKPEEAKDGKPLLKAKAEPQEDDEEGGKRRRRRRTMLVDLHGTSAADLGRISDDVSDILSIMADGADVDGSGRGPKGLWRRFRDRFKQLFKAPIQAVTDFVWDVRERIEGVVDRVRNGFDRIMETMAGWWDNVRLMWWEAKDKLTELLSGVKENLRLMWWEAKDRAAELWEAAKENAQLMWWEAKDKAVELWNNAKDNAQLLWWQAKENLKEMWGNAKLWWKGFKEEVKELWESYKWMWEEEWRDQVKDMMSRVSDKFSKVADTLKEKLDKGLSKLMDLGKKAYEAIKERFSGDKPGLLKRAAGAVKRGFGRAKAWAGEKLGGVMDRVREGPLGRVLEGAKGALGKVGGWLGKAGKGLFGMLGRKKVQDVKVVSAPSLEKLLKGKGGGVGGVGAGGAKDSGPASLTAGAFRKKKAEKEEAGKLFTFRKTSLKHAKSTSENTGGLLEYSKGWFGRIISGLMIFGGLLKGIGLKVASMLGIMKLFNVGKRLLKGAGRAVGGVAKAAWSGGKALVKGVGKMAAGAGKLIKGVGAKTLAKGALKVAGPAALGLGLYDGITDAAEVLNMSPEEADEGRGMRTLGAAAKYGAYGAATGAWIGSIIPGAGTAVGGAVGGAVGALAGAVIANADIVRDSAVKLKDSVVSSWNWTKDAVKDSWNWVKDKAAGVVEWGKGVWDSASGFMSNAWTSVTDLVKKTVSDTWASIKKFFSVDNLIKIIKAGVKALIPGGDFLVSAWDTVTGWFGGDDEEEKTSAAPEKPEKAKAPPAKAQASAAPEKAKTAAEGTASPYDDPNSPEYQEAMNEPPVQGFWSKLLFGEGGLKSTREILQEHAEEGSIFGRAYGDDASNKAAAVDPEGRTEMRQRKEDMDIALSASKAGMDTSKMEELLESIAKNTDGFLSKDASVRIVVDGAERDASAMAADASEPRVERDAGGLVVLPVVRPAAEKRPGGRLTRRHSRAMDVARQGGMPSGVYSNPAYG